MIVDNARNENRQLYSAKVYPWLNQDTGEWFWIVWVNGKPVAECPSQAEALSLLAGEILRLAVACD